MAGTLFLVGTPIGNLGDVTDRARETLSRVDLVAAEDTRRTGRLLRALGLSARQVSFFEGNEARRTRELLAALREGRHVAVVSDAGMPGLSDPGERLVRAAVAAGIEVRVVPGPSAAIAALVVSGLPAARFAFEGFLPRRASERRARLQAVAADPRTLVLYESPRRVRSLLREVVETLGDRRVALCRELTKLHEEVLRGRASEVLAALGDRDPRGEVVLVVEGAAPTGEPSLRAAVEEARGLIEGGMRRRQAATTAARRHGVAANAVYAGLLEPGN